ncbi:nucleotide pyrophosphatase/phosphodiesterase family protein [Sporobolomyces salmoneus]|uniref:nucleotide pyrophosphatase/phosphodiesterase family protein n=1 Tax=Sporobolomyces salmoneus TaxID=183962 RepID=UPI00317CE948
MASYTQLPSHSTAQLPLYSSTSSSSTSPSSPSRRAHDRTTSTDEKALLSNSTDEEEEEELEREVKEYANPTPPANPSSWSERLPLRPRTILFSLLSVSILISLFLFFHPSRLPTSPLPSISHDSLSYYSGAPLPIGLFDPSLGQLSSNPLESDATFADVPFAAVGESWDTEGKRPEWAGGDGGSGAREKQLGKEEGKRWWNGTNWWDRTVVVVTIEGMRPEYLSTEFTPNLLELANRGIRSDSLNPIFPALSAPNHWSILTGLYPSSHGIISNRFRSRSSTSKTFNADSGSSDSSVWDPAWYLGEPIYQTALRSHLRVATLMHPLIPPSLSSPNSRPTYWYPPIPKTHPRKKLSKILSFLDQSYSKRPQLLITNFDEIATQGKKNGVKLSAQHRKEAQQEGEDGEEEEEEGGMLGKSLRMIDESFFGDLMEGLRERGVGDWVEVVVVGVTGMSDVEKDKVVFLDEILDQGTFEQLVTAGGGQGADFSFEGGSSTVISLRPSEADLEKTLNQLRAASREGEGGYDVRTSETMPKEWHFPSGGDDRIAPIWIVAREGWTFTTRTRFEELGGKVGFKATNGYDPTSSESMKTILISSGPFKGGEKSVPSSNLEVYDLIANALDLSVESRALNNGTTLTS